MFAERVKDLNQLPHTSVNDQQWPHQLRKE